MILSVPLCAHSIGILSAATHSQLIRNVFLCSYYCNSFSTIKPVSHKYTILLESATIKHHQTISTVFSATTTLQNAHNLQTSTILFDQVQVVTFSQPLTAYAICTSTPMLYANTTALFLWYPVSTRTLPGTNATTIFRLKKALLLCPVQIPPRFSAS